jgi:hypothetical protein
MIMNQQTIHSGSGNQRIGQRRILTACSVVMLCLVLAACSATDKSTVLSQPQSAARDRMAAMAQAAAQTAQSYKNMDVPSLLNKLAEQSTAKKEPFNSLAYRELKGRDVPAESLATLVNQSKNGNAILPLLLLRKLHEKEYLALPAEERASVLTDALQTSKMFNLWGLPDLYLEDASKALIETGKAAEPALRRLLQDTRPAPVYGSKQYMVYKHYNFRVCDYALFFLKRIQGNADFHLSAQPADRDAQIKALAK